MSKPPTIRSVSQSISIETKNQAIPSVMIATGSVKNLRIGLRTVLRTPNTRAAQTSVQPEPLTLTPLRTHAVKPSTKALVSQETSSQRITLVIVDDGASRRFILFG